MPNPPRNLSEDGRIFFESEDALSPSDVNGHVVDVYEWDPKGVGGCLRAEGCVALISSGRDSQDSRLVDSSPGGEDVFFTTRERLLPRDENEQIDIYDARAPHFPGEAVGFPEGEAAPCGGEACKGPIAPVPPAPSAGSTAVSGEGNAPAEAKQKPKKKHKKHKAKKHKKKTKKRAASQSRGGGK